MNIESPLLFYLMVCQRLPWKTDSDKCGSAGLFLRVRGGSLVFLFLHFVSGVTA